MSEVPLYGRPSVGAYGVSHGCRGRTPTQRASLADRSVYSRGTDCTKDYNPLFKKVNLPRKKEFQPISVTILVTYHADLRGNERVVVHRVV